MILCFIFVLDLTLVVNDTPSALCYVPQFSLFKFFRIWGYTHGSMFHLCFRPNFSYK